MHVHHPKEEVSAVSNPEPYSTGNIRVSSGSKLSHSSLSLIQSGLMLTEFQLRAATLVNDPW